LFERVVGSERNAGQVLEGVQDVVGSGKLVDNASSERHLSKIHDTTLELLEKNILAQIKDGSVENVTLLVDLQDVHFVREWSDSELIEESSLGTIDLISSEDDLLVSNNFYLRFLNFGLDLEILEETSLLWVKTSWSGSDPDIIWSNGTRLSWGLSLLIIDDFLDISQVSVGEDNCGVSSAVGTNKRKLVSLNPGFFSFFVIFIFFLWLGLQVSDGGLHEGVLSVDHDSVDFSESLSYFADLFRTDVVAVNE